MRSQSIKLCLVFCLTGFWLMCQSQTNPYPIQEWIKKLSVRKDVRSERLKSVVEDIISLDSSQYCTAVSRLEESGPGNNKRFRIRLNVVKSFVSFQRSSCPGWASDEVMLTEALQMAYQIEDQFLIADLNQKLVRYYRNIDDFGSAGMYGLVAKEMQERLGIENFEDMAFARHDLGHILFHSREYEAAIEVSKQAVFWAQQPGAFPSDSLQHNYKMNAWNTIGLCYEKLEQYDSALVAFDRALFWQKSGTNQFWYGLIRGNQGDVYFKMGQYDSALVLLQYDYEQSMATEQFFNAANSLQWIARIHAIQGEPELALKEAREASRLLQLTPIPEYKANLLFTFTQVFKYLGNADSLDTYMKLYLTLHDSLEKKAAADRSEIVRIRMHNMESVNKIMSLNREKQKVMLVRNFIILLILALSAAGYLFFHRERLKLKFQQKQALQDKLKAETETELAVSQLSLFTQHMLEKTNLVEHLQSQLMQKELHDELSASDTDLTQFTILTDEDWEKFKSMFERVHPTFFHNLKVKASDITIAEQRMAALSKLQIPSKKAATILGISPNSVNKTRQRLRYRLGLDPDTDLELYFSENNPE